MYTSNGIKMSVLFQLQIFLSCNQINDIINTLHNPLGK